MTKEEVVAFANKLCEIKEYGEGEISVDGSWFRGFMARHADLLSLRKVEARSKQRALCGTPITIAHFFVVLGRQYMTYATGMTTRSGVRSYDDAVCTCCCTELSYFIILIQLIAV
jgi:hypothetical protein